MGTECIGVKEETDGIPSIPPGFASLTSFQLQRVHDGVQDALSSVSSDSGKSVAAAAAAGYEACRKSLRQRPWVNYSLFDCSSDEEELDCELLREEVPLMKCLPKGVIRGCSECKNCQKVTARWRPQDARRPILDDAPVFYPSEEEFKDTLKYIESIRPRAEHYGICRIVPPSSWRPPCPLKETDIWMNSKFDTRIQQVDKLQNRESFKKIYEKCGIMRRKRQKLCKMDHMGVENMIEVGKPRYSENSERFGFIPGPEFTLDAFQKYADEFKEQYFQMTTEFGTSPFQQEPSIDKIEGEYWRIVERPTEEIEVLYGADLDTSVFGSGFPKALSSQSVAELENHYTNSGWNLNNFPRLLASVLSFESGDISGVLVPWLYIGMCFSSFCWHVEDHHLYSLNYLHWGSPKMWYGVPGKDATKLEEAMKKFLPDLFDEQPDLLHNLVTQCSPSLLRLEGIPVYRCVQNEGEFVLTFPRAYHSGFNCGFNCAEAVNVAPVDWLPLGQTAVELYREQRRKISISHDKLLLGAAREAVKAHWNISFLRKNTSDNLRWNSFCRSDGILAKSLKARIDMERARREHLCSSQTRKMDPGFDANSEKECVICHYDLHLSAVCCPCSPDKFACLMHAKELCSCSWNTRLFLFRYDITELNVLLDALGGKLSAVHRWGISDLGLSLSSYVTKEKTQESKPVSMTRKDGKEQDSGLLKLNGGIAASVVGCTSSKEFSTSMQHQVSWVELKERVKTTISAADVALGNADQHSAQKIQSLAAPLTEKPCPVGMTSKDGREQKDSGLLNEGLAASVGGSSLYKEFNTSMQHQPSLVELKERVKTTVGAAEIALGNADQHSAQKIRSLGAPLMKEPFLGVDNNFFEGHKSSDVTSEASSNHQLLSRGGTIDQTVSAGKCSFVAEKRQIGASFSTKSGERDTVSFCEDEQQSSRSVLNDSGTIIRPNDCYDKASCDPQKDQVLRTSQTNASSLSERDVNMLPSFEVKNQDRSCERGYFGFPVGPPVVTNKSSMLIPLDVKNQEGSCERGSFGFPDGPPIACFPPKLSESVKSANVVVEKAVPEASDSDTAVSQIENPQVSYNWKQMDENKELKGNQDFQSNFVDRGKSVTGSASCMHQSLDRHNNQQKGPRMAKVVRRINCNVEALEYGVVHSGRLWSTSQAIFPKGYRSRARYISILDPTQMCYYISEILDAQLLGPLFMVVVEQRPSEVFIHVSATRAWDMVRERVNNEIRKQHNMGRLNLPSLQPPGSLDGLEMFGLSSPAVIRAIEALDPNHVCTEYWRTKASVAQTSGMLKKDQTSGISNGQNHREHSLTAVSESDFRGLLMKANPEELHALRSLIGDDMQRNSRQELIQLLDKELCSRHPQ